MATCLKSGNATITEDGAPGATAAVPSKNIDIALLTGGFDKPYAFGIAMQMLSRDVSIDFIGSDALDAPELRADPKLSFFSFRASPQSNEGVVVKALREVRYYAQLIGYAATAKPGIFHLLWNNKAEIFDRTLLTLYYKLLGKKLVFTAHNVNAGIRDSRDSFLNRLSLRIQYALVDHIFVHTELMKQELLTQFNIPSNKATVIPFGINNAVPNTDLTPAGARKKLGISSNEKTILFFGTIRPYKGLEHLVEAFQRVAAADQDYRLIIAGGPIRESQEYTSKVQEQISSHASRDRVIQKIEYVPDEDTELYFKAADVIVLPYTHVFQSGVLFLGYSFGLPVIASDVGSIKDDIIPGETGYLCQPCDPAGLARTIETYFESNLYKNLDRRRGEIQEYANQKHSWDIVGEKTRDVYMKLSCSDVKSEDARYR